MDKRLGFIGLGLMGSQIVRRLCACGYQITAYDRDTNAAGAIRGLDGLITANSAAEVAKAAKVLCLCLPGPAEAKEVYFGENGILKSAATGTVVIEFSTIGPDVLLEAEKVAAPLGIDLLDSPISGGPESCLEGTAKLIVGGKESVFARVEEVLKCLGEIFRAKALGDGQTIKLINNTMSFGNFIISLEAFVLGVKAGVQPDLLCDILCSSGARAYQLEKRLPKVVKGDFEPGSKMRLARKDISLALKMGQDLEFPLIILRSIYEIFNAGIAKGLAEKDFSAVVHYYENLVDTKVHKA